MAQYDRQKRHIANMRAKAKAYDELETQYASLKSEYASLKTEHAILCVSADAMMASEEALRRVYVELRNTKTEKGKRILAIIEEALA